MSANLAFGTDISVRSSALSLVDRTSNVLDRSDIAAEFAVITYSDGSIRIKDKSADQVLQCGTNGQRHRKAATPSPAITLKTGRPKLLAA